MPMEDIRRRLMGDVNIYPEFGGPRTSGQQTNAASSSSKPAEPQPRHQPPVIKRSTIIISSDEEEEAERSLINISDDESDVVQVSAGPVQSIPKPQQQQRVEPTTPSMQPQPQPFLKPSVFPNRTPATPIHIPSNRDLPKSIPPRPMFAPRLNDNDRVDMPVFSEDNAYMPPAEAEKALRDLMGGAMEELDEVVDIDPEKAYVPGFNEGIKLLPHQIIGREWMKGREDISLKRTGGILADDMGLGKTIQTLTRIVEGRAKQRDKDDGCSASTLVVCPLALVGQWADEITKMTGLRVSKHQGTSRTADPAVLRRHHVVVTTYDTLKSEHQVYSPPVKDESKATSKKKEDGSDDDDSDSDFVRKKQPPATKKGPKKKCALFEVKWFRVVLDEAHNIKNYKTKGAIACCELQSKFRWCLTGTPMQNNVTELYSLIKFLRIKPLSNLETFNEQIAKPVNSGRGASRAMKRLQVVLKQIMLRRTKDQTLNGKALIQLPKRTVEVLTCAFDPAEREFYDSLETKMEGVIEKLMANSKGGSNYISVLLLLLRLRQACNHPILVSKDYKKDSEALEPKSVEKGKEDNEADADDDLIAAFGQLGVTKKCQMCTIELRPGNAGEGEWSTHCSDCVPLAIKAKRLENERPSSAKIRMILKLLQDIDERSDSQEKTIIFSQFTSMLDLIEPFLHEKGIKYVRYDGSMLPKDREASLDKIRNKKDVRVILISFKAGSTGLNLTACNNVILVDLWWNPALEDQAFDRAHRFGQERDVNIFKLKIGGTVEDRILLLQEKKRALAAAALSGDKIKNMRLGMDDLLALFRPGGKDDDEEDYE